MQLAIFNDLSGTSIDVQNVAWEELVSRCVNPTVYASKEAMPLLKIAAFGTTRSARGSLRHDDNMISVDGIECDYDAGIMSPAEAYIALEMKGIDAVIYTTPSHTARSPRWRVLVPLSRSYPPQDRRLFVAMLNGVLGEVLANESFSQSQSFYFGRVVGREYVSYVTKGARIDTIPGLPQVFPMKPIASVTQANEITEETVTELREALRFLNSDDRVLWVANGQSLRGLGETGWLLWDEWSKQSDKYDAADSAKKWATFSAERTDYRAIFSKAQVLGWVNPKAGRAAQVDTQAVFAQHMPFNQKLFRELFDAHRKESKGKTGGAPLATIENLEIVMKGYGFSCYYDELLKRQMLVLPGQHHVVNDCTENGALQTLRSVLALNEVPESTSEKLAVLFMRNVVNPVKQFIHSKPWDGVSRLEALCNAVIVAPGDVTYRNALIRMWLVQCIAALDGAAASPIPHAKAKYETVLLFRGKQGDHKTSFIQSLLPREYGAYILDGVQLDLSDKDSIFIALKGWITELGEFDGVLRKSDTARIKSFLSNMTDSMRLPYDRVSSNFQRRTSFCGTVNEKRFLIDPTGNRRFPVIDVIEATYQHNVDMQQLWAEVWQLYLAGEQWWPTPELAAEIADHHKEHTRLNHVHDAIITHFDLDSSPTSNKAGNLLTLSEILTRCGVQNNNHNLSELKNLLAEKRIVKQTSRGKHGYHLAIYNHFAKED